MTKKLAELFDLPEQESQEEIDTVISSEPTISEETLSNIEKIEAALPQVRGLEANDIEMDNLANSAVSSYKDLMDLGMQVDSRFSSEIFSVAATMLGHAITAKTAKATKKLKTIELQLKYQALLAKQTEKEKEIDAIPLGEGKAFDRNELLRMMIDRTANSTTK